MCISHSGRTATYYLTGLAEPDAIVVLVPGREHASQCSSAEKNPEKSFGMERSSGPEGAIEELGFDDAFPHSDIDDILPGMIEGKDKVYYSMGMDAAFDKRVMEWINVIRSKVRSGAHPPGEFVALEHYLHDMRPFKSSVELGLWRKPVKSPL